MEYPNRPRMRYAPMIGLAVAGWLMAAAGTAADPDQHDRGQHQHGAHEHDRGQHQHGAHEHGVGRLNLVLEGGVVYMELDSPAANLLGFEHPPASAADRARLDRAVAALEHGDRLFRFDTAADCRQADVALSSALLEPGHGPSDPGHEADGGHADFVVEYRFHCQHPEHLRRLDVGLFTTFPATERLQLQFIVDDRQGAATLTGANPDVQF